MRFSILHVYVCMQITYIHRQIDILLSNNEQMGIEIVAILITQRRHCYLFKHSFYLNKNCLYLIKFNAMQK